MAGGPQDLSELEKDPRLFLYTSLTAGSSHIITATSRMETILKANRIPFQAIDVATDEKARRLWGRRAGKRKLPGLVKEGFVIGDLEQVEEWNEFGEIKEAIGPCPPAGAPVAPVLAPRLPVKPTATAGSAKVTPAPAPSAAVPAPIALPGAAEIAARNNPLPKSSPENAAKPETMASAPAEKEKSIAAATATATATAADSKYDHLSAPASAIVSGTATPTEKTEEKTEEKKEDEPKKEEENTPSDKEDTSKYDHLSVPASAIPSGTATPAEPAAAEEEKPSTHLGSDVADAPSEDVKKVESKTALSEEATAEDVGSVAKGMEGLQVGEGKNVGEQEAKKAEDAVKSVED
ncbi:hypothetical protein Q7P37_009406 [Cladosporium fusiforme]